MKSLIKQKICIAKQYFNFSIVDIVCSEFRNVDKRCDVDLWCGVANGMWRNFRMWPSCWGVTKLSGERDRLPQGSSTVRFLATRPGGTLHPVPELQL